MANVMAERTWFIVTSKEGLVPEGCDYGVLLNTGSPHTGPRQVREAWQEQFILSQAGAWGSNPGRRRPVFD